MFAPISWVWFLATPYPYLFFNVYLITLWMTKIEPKTDIKIIGAYIRISTTSMCSGTAMDRLQGSWRLPPAMPGGGRGRSSGVRWGGKSASNNDVLGIKVDSIKLFSWTILFKWVILCSIIEKFSAEWISSWAFMYAVSDITMGFWKNTLKHIIIQGLFVKYRV